MKKLLTQTGLLCLALSSMAQNPQSSIATWKNNAKGAYSFIHDDFGDYSVIGINNYADTIARNRNLKFTFGAITSSCEGNPGMWDDAKDMIAYGHEIINHSHTHTCAVTAAGWCETGLWAEPATEDFATQMTYSTTLINNRTGSYPRYFIYPYDLYNEDANNHLKSLNYIGSRTGAYNAENLPDFAPDAEGFFRSAFVVEADAGNIPLASLNDWADFAIANGAWVNREMHNVGTSGWGHIEIDDYRSHLNYLQSKVAGGDLWVGTISEMLTYQIQKLNYSPSTTYDANQNKITISWNTPSFDVANYLAPLSVKTSVTILVDLDGINSTGMKVYQGSSEITDVTVSNGIMSFDAYPTEGTIIISKEGCPTLCLNSNISDQTVWAGNSASFTFSVSSSNAITYKWYLNNVLIQGETGATLQLNDIQKTQEGTYKVVATSGIHTLESTALLTVIERKTFNVNPVEIPGTVQFEEFDIAGEGYSFHDSSPTNQGDASNFRTESVDIENTTGGGYNLGYCTVGEWLEYTVDVKYAGSYTVKVRNASTVSTGKIKLYLDGAAVSSNLSFTSTGGWQTFKTSTFSGIVLSSGRHILKAEITGKDVNLDYMQFTVDSITNVQNIETTKSIEAFPNPFENLVTVALKDNYSTLRILNSEGKTIELITLNANQNSCTFGENLNAGIYFVEAFGPMGIERIKLIKK